MNIMGDIQFQFFDPSQPIEHLSGNLPHWRQDGVRYFVTFRLADSIPQDKLRQWQHEKDLWLKRNPPPRTAEQVSEFWRLFPNDSIAGSMRDSAHAYSPNSASRTSCTACYAISTRSATNLGRMS